jgi:hypothetical protein
MWCRLYANAKIEGFQPTRAMVHRRSEGCGRATSLLFSFEPSQKIWRTPCRARSRLGSQCLASRLNWEILSLIAFWSCCSCSVSFAMRRVSVSGSSSSRITLHRRRSFSTGTGNLPSAEVKNIYRGCSSDARDPVCSWLLFIVSTP